jgi:hypothetical protein
MKKYVHLTFQILVRYFKFINGIPAKSQFLQFYSQQSWAFFRLPAEKDSYCSCVISHLYKSILSFFLSNTLSLNL